MTAVLSENSYGKSRIRLTRVTRCDDRHEIRELVIDVRLEGDFAASYLTGDNSQIIATDTMKNTVYALAQGRPAEAIEEFGAALTSHFLNEHAHVNSVSVNLAEQLWKRIPVDGNDHPHAFIAHGGETRTAFVRHNRSGLQVEAGISGLNVLKTTRSSFVGFLRDRLTTLRETTDRIFATEIQARWRYSARPIDWDVSHQIVRSALLETFATHDSKSVQQTLFAMGEAALERCAELAEITLVLPNKHRIPFDLSPFGQENANEIFVATDEPFGLITGTLRRA